MGLLFSFQTQVFVPCSALSSVVPALPLHVAAMMEDEDGVGSTGFMEVVVDKISKQG